MITIKEVDRLRKAYFTSDIVLPWIRVEEIVGADMEQSRSLNRRLHIDHEDVDDEESDDEIIVEYLNCHLLQQTKGMEDITGPELIETVVFLIVHFWSGASIDLTTWDRVVNRDNANRCITLIREAFISQDEWMPKYLLSSLTTEILNPCCNGVKQRDLLSYLDNKNREFFQFLVKDTKYTSLTTITIPKKEAADG